MSKEKSEQKNMRAVRKSPRKKVEERIKLLEVERDGFKLASERLAGNYLDKCAEVGRLKRELRAYRHNWPRMKGIAQEWKDRSQHLCGLLEIAVDAIQESVSQTDWFIGKIPFYKRIIYRKTIKEMNEAFYSYISKIESLL